MARQIYAGTQEYIRNNNGGYVITGTKITKNMKIVVDLKFGTKPTEQTSLFGVYYTANYGFIVQINSDSKWKYQYIIGTESTDHTSKTCGFSSVVRNTRYTAEYYLRRKCSISSNKRIKKYIFNIYGNSCIIK